MARIKIDNNKSKDTKKLISIIDASANLGISYAQLKHYVKKRKIKTHQINEDGRVGLISIDIAELPAIKKDEEYKKMLESSNTKKGEINYEDYITVEEAANTVGCSLSTIYSRISSGDLKRIKRGKINLIEKKHFEKFIKSNPLLPRATLKAEKITEGHYNVLISLDSEQFAFLSMISKAQGTDIESVLKKQVTAMVESIKKAAGMQI